MAAGRRGGSVGSGHPLEPLPALPGLAFLVRIDSRYIPQDISCRLGLVQAVSRCADRPMLTDSLWRGNNTVGHQLGI